MEPNSAAFVDNDAQWDYAWWGSPKRVRTEGKQQREAQSELLRTWLIHFVVLAILCSLMKALLKVFKFNVGCCYFLSLFRKLISNYLTFDNIRSTRMKNGLDKYNLQ